MSKEIEELINKQQIGSTSTKLRLTEISEYRLACQHLAEQAHRSLFIFSYDLDASLFDQQPFIDAVKQLALQGRSNHIQILLQNNERVQREGHRLIELSRKLTSKIEIRHPHSDYIDTSENYIIADTTGYIRKRMHSGYEGEMDFNDPLVAKNLAEHFSVIWERSEPDSSLRRLYL